MPQLLLYLHPVDSFQLILVALVLSFQQGALDHDHPCHEDVRFLGVEAEGAEFLALDKLALFWRKVSVFQASFVEDRVEIGASGPRVDVNYFDRRLRSQEYGFGREALMELVKRCVLGHCFCELQ